jgi:hypothetical protein
MIILTSSTKATNKAQIRSMPATGFKKLYTASCPKSELCAAKSVVRKWFGNAPAESVSQLTDADQIRQLTGDFFNDAKRKQVFNVWTFNPKAV